MHAAGKDGLRMHTTFCRKPVLEPYEITHVNVPRLDPSQADWYSILLTPDGWKADYMYS